MKKMTVVAVRVELILVMPSGPDGIRQLVCLAAYTFLSVFLRSIWGKMKRWISRSAQKLILRLLSCPLF